MVTIILLSHIVEIVVPSVRMWKAYCKKVRFRLVLLWYSFDVCISLWWTHHTHHRYRIKGYSVN